MLYLKQAQGHTLEYITVNSLIKTREFIFFKRLIKESLNRWLWTHLQSFQRILTKIFGFQFPRFEERVCIRGWGLLGPVLQYMLNHFFSFLSYEPRFPVFPKDFIPAFREFQPKNSIVPAAHIWSNPLRSSLTIRPPPSTITNQTTKLVF